MHKHITMARVLNTARRALTGQAVPGFCIECGKVSLGSLDPATEQAICYSCGTVHVYGAVALADAMFYSWRPRQA